MSEFTGRPAPKKPYPSTPAQKVRRRLGVARKTGRLDLSTEMSSREEVKEDEGSVDVSTLTENKKINIWAEPEAPKASDMKSEKKQTVEFFLEEIPKEAFDIKGLNELWLCNNRLRVVSPQLADIHTLQVLSLANVGLDHIPLEISALIQLKRLYLQNNKISAVPEELRSLTSLTDINLRCNQLEGEFPAVILTLYQLAYINISGNDITEIPNDIIRLNTLTVLDVSNSRIESVKPEIIRRMPELIIVGASGSRRRTIWSPDLYGISAEDEMELVSFIKGRAKKLSTGSIEKQKTT